MDSVSIDFTSLAKAATKSPGGAVLRALVLPGWGQFYTGHAVRGGLAAALETVFFTSAFIQYRDRNKLRDQLKRLERELGDQTPAEDPRVDLNDRIRNRSLKGGDYLAYGLTTLVLSLIDSYVSAHLYQFDRNFQVSVSGGSSLAFRFQLDLLGVVRPVSRSHPATATPAR